MNKLKTPVKAIRAKCLDCSGFQPSEVRKCEDAGCPLFAYRLGKNPSRARIGKNTGQSCVKTPAELTIVEV